MDISEKRAIVNLSARFLFSISMGCLCLMLPNSLQADSVYTYTSTPYGECQEAYAIPDTGNPGTCNSPIWLTITLTLDLSGSQLDNLTGQATDGTANLTADVTNFEFSDEANGSGGAVDIQGTAGDPGLQVDLATDSNGNPTAWAVSFFGDSEDGYSGYELCTDSMTYNGVCTNQALNITLEEEFVLAGWNYEQGNWTLVSTSIAPEPSGLLMLGGGLLGLLTFVPVHPARFIRSPVRVRDVMGAE